MLRLTFVIAVLAASILVSDSADARGRRSSCANGQCSVSSAPAAKKTEAAAPAGEVPAPAAPAVEKKAEAAVPAPAAPVAAAQPQVARRGWFGRRYR